MSIGDGRHKLATREEREIHGAILRETRALCERWAARRLADIEEAEGIAVNKTVALDELAEALGMSRRQLSAYGSDVPITLAKAVRLSQVSGDPALLHLFARYLGALAVRIPRPEEIAGLAEVNAELFANSKEAVEFQGAALAMGGEEYGPDDHAITSKEGLEDMEQSVRLILASSLKATGKAELPAALHLTRSNGGNQ